MKSCFLNRTCSFFYQTWQFDGMLLKLSTQIKRSASTEARQDALIYSMIKLNAPSSLLRSENSVSKCHFCCQCAFSLMWLVQGRHSLRSCTKSNMIVRAAFVILLPPSKINTTWTAPCIVGWLSFAQVATLTSDCAVNNHEASTNWQTTKPLL